MNVVHRPGSVAAPGRAAGHSRAVPRWAGGPIGLAVSLAAVAAVAAVGGLWTDTGADSWYRQLDKPPWNPPDWVFGPVWTALYVAMAVAAWLVARSCDVPAGRVRLALGLYAAQLALNLGWTGVFFGLERPGWAVAEIAVLLAAVLATIWAFARVRRAAALLLVPYAAWVAYAGSLTMAIAILN